MDREDLRRHHVLAHEAASPRVRVVAISSSQSAQVAHPNAGYMYAGEVVRMLRLDDIDYRQVRSLLLLVREQAGEPATPKGRWIRYSATDIAAFEVLLDLCGGREALAPGRRLRLAGIRDALVALRTSGFTNPLLQVRLRKEGRRVFAELNGTLFDPTSGQVALSATLGALNSVARDEPEMSTALDLERQRFEIVSRAVRTKPVTGSTKMGEVATAKPSRTSR